MQQKLNFKLEGKVTCSSILQVDGTADQAAQFIVKVNGLIRYLFIQVGAANNG